ncbi:MAG TPA: ATP-binding protein, partial [Pseudonocardiaceae bacterium]|nr:ATP-binding protein [Pseudonocardiaceae bacterium]
MAIPVTSTPVLVGREAELATARRLLDASKVGEGGLLLVTGEAGIGKSRLLAEVAALARGGARRGACVGGDPVPADVLEVLLTKAEELPVLVEELLAGLLEPRLGPAPVPTPPTLAGLVARRMASSESLHGWSCRPPPSSALSRTGPCLLQ